MANQEKGEAEFTLADGRTIKLVFDTNAWCEIEDALDRPIQDILADLKAKPPRAGIKFQRAIMFGGLRRHHPEFTLIEAGDILIEAAAAMEKAMGASMPKGDGEVGEDAKADPPSRSRGTGTKP